MNDSARVSDSTQWLQDSSGFGIYISTKTLTDVSAIYSRLQRAMQPMHDVDAELLIIEADYANAFIARRYHKQYICVTVPMVILLGNDLALYGALLAHNLGHVAGRHQQDIGRGLIFLNALGYEIIPDHTPARLVAPLGLEAIEGTYSDSQEREADSLALAMMLKAQLDATALIRLHEFLKTNSPVEGSFLATHPDGDERARNMRRTINAGSSR